MKMKPPLCLKSLFLGLIFLFTTQARGQGNVDFSVGVGFPELVNLGLRIQLGQSQFGFYGGTIPGAEEKILTLGADFYYHFGSASSLSDRKPWFAKAGLSYFYEENDSFEKTSLFLVPRIGRDFNFSRRIGIALEGGAFFLLSHKEVEIKPRNSPCWLCEGGFVSIGPSFGLSLFFRL